MAMPSIGISQKKKEKIPRNRDKNHIGLYTHCENCQGLGDLISYSQSRDSAVNNEGKIGGMVKTLFERIVTKMKNRRILVRQIE